MTKTPPYVTTFDQIKPGQLIEREWTFKGRRFRVEGVAHHLTPAGRQWHTVEGGVVADCANNTDTLRVLAEPAEPALPTEGYIEVWGSCPTGEVHLEVATHVGGGDWYGFTKDGGSSYLRPSQITCWRRVRIVPADDGLREQVEKLVEDFAAKGGYLAGAGGDYQHGKGDGLLLAVEELRRLLGADA